MKGASTSKTSVNFYQTTRRNNPEDSHLHTRRRKKLKCHSFEKFAATQLVKEFPEYLLPDSQKRVIDRYPESVEAHLHALFFFDPF
jgi:hypothetical protein